MLPLVDLRGTKTTKKKVNKKVVVALLDAGAEHTGRRVQKRGFAKASASGHR